MHSGPSVTISHPFPSHLPAPPPSLCNIMQLVCTERATLAGLWALLLLFPPPKVLLIPKAPCHHLSQLLVLHSEAHFRLTHPPNLRLQPRHCMESGTATRPSLCRPPDSGGHPLRILPDPPRIPDSAVTGSGSLSQAPHHTVVHEAGAMPSSLGVPREPAGVSIKCGWKGEESAYVIVDRHPFEHVRCINSSCLQYPKQDRCCCYPHFPGEASRAVAELGLEP